MLSTHQCIICIQIIWYDSFTGPSDEEILLLTIPNFVKSSTAVLVNLTTLQALPVSFQGYFPATDDSASPEIDK